MNCTNPHMSLSHQSVLVEVMKKSPFLTVKWLSAPLMRNAKQKKKKKDPPLGIKLCSLPPFHRKWRDEYIYWIRRDWRGSNPQLPPWQGGALTDWTTIPGKLGVQPKINFDSNHLVSLCCKRETNDILYYYY